MTPWVLDISQKMLFVSLLKISKDISVQIYIQEMSSYYQAHLLSPVLFFVELFKETGWPTNQYQIYLRFVDTVFFKAINRYLAKKNHIYFNFN